jgi:hypothetical protein
VALASLHSLGLDLNTVTERLQSDSVAAFAASLNRLLATLDRKRGIGGQIMRTEGGDYVYRSKLARTHVEAE